MRKDNFFFFAAALEVFSTSFGVTVTFNQRTVRELDRAVFPSESMENALAARVLYGHFVDPSKLSYNKFVVRISKLKLGLNQALAIVRADIKTTFCLSTTPHRILAVLIYMYYKK